MRRISRRQFLIGAGMAIGTPAAAATWGYDPDRLEVTRHRVVVPALAEQMLAVQVSDLHADRAGSCSATLRERVAARVRLLEPDLIFATGDFITRPGDAIDEAVAWVAGLEARLGRYAVLGNHDPAGVGLALEAAGVEVLENSWTSVRGLNLAGVGDLGRGPHRPREALAGIPQGAGTILLAHQPDSFWAYQRPVTLQLSGHTHGGQVTLMGAYPLPRLMPRLQEAMAHIPELDRLARRKFQQTRRGAWSGFFRRPDGSSLYVNRGLGRFKRISFYCAPELTVWDLVPG